MGQKQHAGIADAWRSAVACLTGVLMSGRAWHGGQSLFMD